MGRRGGGAANRYAVLRAGRASFLMHRRSVLVAVALLLVLAAGFLLALCVGDRFTPPSSVLAALTGGDSPDAFTVEVLRLPRATVGLLVGVCLGLSGATVQTVARNPLASPDIIGVTQGAAAATVVCTVLGVASAAAMPFVAIGGGIAATALVYGLAWRRGLHAQRFVLIGIGISLALQSVVHLFLTKGDALQAQQAKVWITGSLNGTTWSSAWPPVIALAACLVPLVWAARAQRAVALDDATATGLGTRLDRSRLGLIAIGVVLASVAAGAAGPISFVALVAPQLARRLTRTSQLPLVCAGLAGAVIVTVADILARVLLSPTELPVGVLTAVVGAPYMLWLLARSRTGGRS
ncbi:iron ABC transporter [Mangrovactinospora gilvigrisea]|uniref:Iron ABC transporter n=1 Tax=Mangrovactinospora gilvigrisea TaxID=1428644 RepID=A0A1J7C691_9ACTN|nr:iron ABC transporter permease [Mangrovactinospora gilvigrisea]OIV37052.1 iron ABC transporter [Mangrovactinospora gilvigrisea]